ncbi:SH3 domain-containing protein [Brumimicrobium glaciale]|uniref:SH3 domain-containing protein n=1 Tax=Brumimicrobium glaciale TaxID=200475 RepID=A0A4Q4KLF2_9FLAO|nr:SH3 domain-containing protein [Brumimicrobium glaciale]RYM33770.1 SH3 domain-containing protein [Brumimicrobium glaciale]
MKHILSILFLISMSLYSFANIPANNSYFHNTHETKLENDKKNTFIVTAKNGIIIRKNPSLESKRIGLIPFGSKINISEKTNEKLSIHENGKEIKGNWVKIKTHNYPYNYAEEAEYGYVFDGFLENEDVFIQDLENLMKAYPEFNTYEIDRNSNPFILNGDFFGDNVNDLVIKIKDSKLITLGFINYKQENKSEAVIITKNNLADTELYFGWTEQFETVSSNINLWPEDEEMSNLNVDFNHPANKKLVLGYNAIFGHNLESCGGGYIFWYKNKFHTITGD